MRLPATWTKMSPRPTETDARSARYVHRETGVEVWKMIGGWVVGVPGKPGPTCPASAIARHAHMDYKTMAAAIAGAEDKVIPAVREVIAKVWDDAQWHQIGTPETWTEGQADDETVHARHAAIIATRRGTGSEARKGDLVKHVELGTIGVFDHCDLAGAHVRFSRDAEPSLVHTADVVVLIASYCMNIQPDHNEHDAAVTSRCLERETEDPDVVGAPLVEVRPYRWRAADGVQMLQSSDGPGPGPDKTQTETRTRTETRTANTVDLADMGPGPVAFGFWIEAQTADGWRMVRTDYTPPIWWPVQTVLDAVADTILSNARQVLGLGPKDLMPAVRVETWHRQSGLTGFAALTPIS